MVVFVDIFFYDGVFKEVELIGNVIFINGECKLFIKKFYYDFNIKIVIYEIFVMIIDGEI